MALSWLHVSDFHFRCGDPYDREVVLRALVRSVRDYRDRGRRPDLIFATGDVAHGGKQNEYEAATVFFDALLDAAGVDKRRLFVIPGNHDVDRDFGIGLARTLGSREEADTYFRPDAPKVHILLKLREFVRWYDAYFAGIRSFPEDSTCGPVELVEIGPHKLGILPVNSALFCQDDGDHGELWVGRRCLDAGIEALGRLGAELSIGLIHHPLDWLHDAEVANVEVKLQSAVDLILRGHLHRNDFRFVAGDRGGVLHLGAGAAYQTRRWPDRALYVTIEGGEARVFPIRYEDEPHEVWTVDPSVFPSAPDHTGVFALRQPESSAPPPLPAPMVKPPARTRLRCCNIPFRRNLPFVGRDDLLERIGTALADREHEAVVVLHGAPGVGKSELAREFARRAAEAYPGGRFVVAAGEQALAVDLARLGVTLLDLDQPAGLLLADQAQRVLVSLGGEPTLLIYDNVQTLDAVQPWLPMAGMRCHVLMTTNLDRWDAGWIALKVLPLSRMESVELVGQIAGADVQARFGERLATVADGLPVQLVPASATLAYEARRGRLATASITLAEEAKASFLGVYRQLDGPARLLLHAAAGLNPQRIPRDELRQHLADGAGWSAGEYQRHLDACLDLHLLQDGSELRMHQLFADFLRGHPADGELQDSMHRIVRVQAQRVLALARELTINPNQPALGASLLAFPITADGWDLNAAALSASDGEIVGRALLRTGQYDAARPWFERAIAEAEQGDLHRRVDHASLARNLHQIGYCLSGTGQFKAARPWYERAAAEVEQGDINGRVDHASLGKSQHQVGYCLSEMGEYEAARPWYERAVTNAEQGDVHGQVDHVSLGSSLHAVGTCLSRIGQYEAARPWYERAVAEVMLGDVDGRVNHTAVGLSLHQVGYCLSEVGRDDVAQPWFERAVAEKEQGDIHGRVDHTSLGISVHSVGYCLSRAGRNDAARPWFERAVAEAEKGNVHDRVDYASLGRSLHLIGYCLSQTGQHDPARPWYERAAEASARGDVFGRVDRASLAASQEAVASCLRQLGRAEEAVIWEARAAETRRAGDDPP